MLVLVEVLGFMESFTLGGNFSLGAVSLFEDGNAIKI